MALENLKSIFTEGIEKFKNTDVTTLGGSHVDNPILDTAARSTSKFVTDDLIYSTYKTEQFDPRIPKNAGIQIKNINTYKGTTHTATNPTDFGTAGIGGALYNAYSTPYTPYPGTSFGDTDANGGVNISLIDIFSQRPIPGQGPILDTLLRQPPSFVSDDLLTKHYESENFDPRTPKNIGITFTNVNPYTGTQYKATNPTDFSTAGIGDGVYEPKQIPFTPAPSTIFDFNPLLPPYTSLDFPGGPYGAKLFPGTSPVLDTLLRQPPSFVSNDLTVKHYESENFDPRIPKNIGITFNTNGYMGSALYPQNLEKIRRFNTDGFVVNVLHNTNQAFTGEPFIPLTELGLDLGATNGWQALYTPHHKSHDGWSEFEGTPFQPYSYGGNVNRDKLDIRHKGDRDTSIFSPARHDNLFGSEPEPYIVSGIPINETDPISGRGLNAGDRGVPIIRSTTDFRRISKFLSSPAGLAFILKQNLFRNIPMVVVRGYDKQKAFENKLWRVPQRFGPGYTPLSTLAAISPLARSLGTTPHILFRRNSVDGNAALESDYYGSSANESEFSTTLKALKEISNPNSAFQGVELIDPLLTTPKYNIHSTFNQSSELGGTGENILDGVFGNIPQIAGVPGEVKRTSTGDKMTLAKMIKGENLLTSAGTTSGMTADLTKTFGSGTTEENKKNNQMSFNVEAEKEGMPLYFKDLRDNSYIFFRAYLEGVVENVVGTWNPVNYVGRSSPVYSYLMGERDVGFTLKVFAQTKFELMVIYEKLNKMTSLCYPEYAQDTRLNSNRMKPPLCKLRMGELFGSSNRELLGFIETLNYVIPEESPWETEDGMRVPKFVTITVAFRVIHDEVPNMNSKFYGFAGVDRLQGERLEDIATIKKTLGINN